MMSTRADAALIRAIGQRRLTASIVNLLVGAGIFVLPATVAAGMGTAAPVAYIVCAGLMALVVTCFAAAGSRVSLTGGVYAYVEVAFGPFVAWLTGVLYATMAMFAVATPAGRGVLIAAVFTLLTIVNVRGVKPGSQLVEIITAAKLLPLLLLVAA